MAVFPYVPVGVGITTVLAALVVIFVVILVLLWGLLLPLLPRLRRVHCQLLLQLVHCHRLLLDLVLLVPSTPVIPSVDGARLRSEFFELPPVFTWVMTLVLCPAHCAVHSLMLCWLLWSCVQQYVGVSLLLTLSGRFLWLNLLGLLVPRVGCFPLRSCWCWYYHGSCGLSCYFCRYFGAAVGAVVAAAATVAPRSLPVAVAIGALPSIVAGFGSAGC